MTSTDKRLGKSVHPENETDWKTILAICDAAEDLLEMTARFLLVAQVLALTLFGSRALAGSLTEEANICSQELVTMAKGDAAGSVKLMTIETAGNTQAEAKILQLRVGIQRIIEEVRKFGGAAPVATQSLPDLIIDADGNIVRREIWTLPNGQKLFAGCVRYPAGNNFWSTSVQVEANLAVLDLKLKAASRAK